MNVNLFLAIFSILGLVYFLIGLYASKNIKNTNDYFLAGRNLGLGIATFTLIATQFGGAMLLGTSQKAYDVGILGILYTLGMSTGFLILGAGLASRLQATQAETTAQLFELKYNSKILKQFASILSIITLCGILIGQILAAKSLINGLGIINEPIFIAFWAFIIGYTIIGGLKAVVITDTAQILFIIFIFSGIFIASLLKSPINVIANLPKEQSLFTLDWKNIIELLPTFLMPILFSLIEQDLALKFFSARTKKIAAFSALLAGIFLLIFAFIPVYFGMQAKILNLPIPQGGNPLIPVLEYFTNEFFFVLAICGIIAAITSTADSLLCAISSNISQDFNLSELIKVSKLKTAKIITLFVGTFSLIASYLVPQDIIYIVIQSYEISVSCLFVPTMYCLFKDKLNKNAALYSMIFGLAGFIIFKVYPLPFYGILTLGLSLIGYNIGNLIKK